MVYTKNIEELKDWLRLYSKHIDPDDLKNCLLYEHEALRLNTIVTQIYSHLQKLTSENVNKPPALVNSVETKAHKVVTVNQTPKDSSEVLLLSNILIPPRVSNTTLDSITKKISCNKISTDVVSHQDIESVINYLNSVNVISSDEASYLLRNKDIIDVEGTLRRALEVCLSTSKSKPKLITSDPQVWKYVNNIVDINIRFTVTNILSRFPKKEDVLHSLRLLVVSIKTKQTPRGILSYISNLLKNLVMYINDTSKVKAELTNDVSTIEKLIATIENINDRNQSSRYKS